MRNSNQLRGITTVRAAEKWDAPEWALLERLLFDTMNKAAIEFAHRYTRSDGTLIWKNEWPGMDGSDDPYEGFMNFPLFYVLGGGEEIHQLARKMFDSITWQWTEYGQIYREFDAYYDWMHHGEGSLFFYFLALADPAVLKDKQRALRYAGFYMGEDAEADNFDSGKKLMRSPINGSRGPRFEQTAEDWCTHREVLDNYPPPFEDIPGLSGPTCPWTNDEVYLHILQRINERMAKGDVPLNLTSTSLITHAYLYTGEVKYRQWVLEYLEAWSERTIRNGGIIPDNVGLNDVIGEYNDGKWWGGYYGWRWPHGAFNILESLTIAGCNAMLLEGKKDHLDLIRSQLDQLWELGREQDGAWVVPHKHLDEGWTAYGPASPLYPIYLWTVSMEDQDLQRILRLGDQVKWTAATKEVSKGFIGNFVPWFNYIQGNNPEFPVQILKANYQLILNQLEKIRSEQGDPSLWDVHHWQTMTPMICEGLVQLTLGAPMHVYHGGLQHGRVRYYDAAAERPGLPDDVGALVEALTDDSVTLTLVNLNIQEERQLIIQAGTFAEHSFYGAAILNQAGEQVDTAAAEGKWIQVQLDPGCGIRLRLTMGRYTQQPSYDTPWSSTEMHLALITGRHL